MPYSFYPDGRDPLLDLHVLRPQCKAHVHDDHSAAHLREQLADVLHVTYESDSDSDDELTYGSASRCYECYVRNLEFLAEREAMIKAVDGGMFGSIDGGWVNYVGSLPRSLTRLTLPYDPFVSEGHMHLQTYTNLKELRICCE